MKRQRGATGHQEKRSWCKTEKEQQLTYIICKKETYRKKLVKCFIGTLRIASQTEDQSSSLKVRLKDDEVPAGRPISCWITGVPSRRRKRLTTTRMMKYKIVSSAEKRRKTPIGGMKSLISLRETVTEGKRRPDRNTLSSIF